MARHGKVDLEQQELADGNLGGQFKPRGPRLFREILFEETELAVLREVAERFAKVDAKRIIATSHDEEAWVKHEADHSIIDYNLAFELKAFEEQAKS